MSLSQNVEQANFFLLRPHRTQQHGNHYFAPASLTLQGLTSDLHFFNLFLQIDQFRCKLLKQSLFRLSIPKHFTTTGNSSKTPTAILFTNYDYLKLYPNNNTFFTIFFYNAQNNHGTYESRATTIAIIRANRTHPSVFVRSTKKYVNQMSNCHLSLSVSTTFLNERLQSFLWCVRIIDQMV